LVASKDSRPFDHTTPSWVTGPGLEGFAFADQVDLTGLELETILPTSDNFPLHCRPDSQASYEELITTLFQRRTCGILSVKYDCDDNPWRSLVWPLTRNNPALSYAISAMTCLHLCSSRPELHSKGLMHVQQSIGILREPLEFGTIQVDVALATKLALGLAKSWEASRTSTGFEHLKEAKILLEKRYQVLENTEISLKRTRRLSFLANTWMYMDVIARLTTFGPDDCIDTKLITACNLLQKRTRDTKLDPLMGCASDCSVIGKAADLVRRI
jgi:hypothetical protein